jgi:hypothetical protein
MDLAACQAWSRKSEIAYHAWSSQLAVFLPPRNGDIANKKPVTQQKIAV